MCKYVYMYVCVCMRAYIVRLYVHALSMKVCAYVNNMKVLWTEILHDVYSRFIKREKDIELEEPEEDVS